MPDNVRYLLTTLDPQANGQPIAYPIAELPFTGVTFSMCFNQAGPFSATLSIEDRQVQASNWQEATNPGKTFFWIQIDGQWVYGGRILDRDYDIAAQTVTLTGTDFYGYWCQRLQAQAHDYTAYIQTYVGASKQTYAWAAKTHAVPVAGAPTPMIAWQILQDAAAVTGSLPNLTVPLHGQGPGAKSDPDNWVANYPAGSFMTFSAPLSQQQSVDSLLQQFVAMNYAESGGVPVGPGIDIVTALATDADGNPEVQTWVAWPRYGETAAEQGYVAGVSPGTMKILDLSTVIDPSHWTEDASSQAVGIVEMAGAGGVKSAPMAVDTGALGHNYPLTEMAASHTSTSPHALAPAVLAALLQGDRDLYAYPQIAPVLTLPCFPAGNGWALTSLPMGEDIGVFNPFERMGEQYAGSLPFPSWSTLATMRLVRADVTIADAGLSTMALTLNPPPGSPSPPGYR